MTGITSAKAAGDNVVQLHPKPIWDGQRFRGDCPFLPLAAAFRVAEMNRPHHRMR
jgi:hypothetical protein